MRRPQGDGPTIAQRALVGRRQVVSRVLLGVDVVARFTEPARAWARPVTSVITVAAWWAMGVILVLLATFLAWHWAEALVGAALLIAVLVLAIVFVLGTQQWQAEFHLNRGRVVVGQRASGQVTLTNSSSRRALPLEMEFPVGTTTASFAIPSLPGGGVHDELFAIPTTRRAVLDLGPVHAVRADPLRILRRDERLTEPDVLYVHPLTTRIEGSASGFIRDLEGETIRKISDHDVAFHALREYVPGDDRRFIHWKTSARTGTLMVRQFEETRRSHLLVALSTRLDDYASDEEFELAVSVAASLGAQTLRDGYTLSAMTSTQNLRCEHPVVLLDQYSGVAFDVDAPRLSETIRRLGNQISGASVAIFVCGSLGDAAELRRARRMIPLEVRTIVIRAEPGAEMTLRTMGDIDATTIGELDHLSATMRRLSR